MADAGRKVPVTKNLGGIGIVAAKNTVVDPHRPGGALIARPAGHLLGAGDDCPQRLYTAVGDPFLFGAAACGIDPFPVNAGGNQHLIARPGHLCGVIDVAEGPGFAAVSL